LTSALVGGEWSSSRSVRFTHGERAPGTHWIGSWVDPRAGLDDMEKRKFLTIQGLNSDPLVVQPVVSRHTDYAIPAPHYTWTLEFPVTVAALSKARTLFGSSDIRIASLNPTRDMNTFFAVCCVCGERRCDRPIPRLRSPTNCLYDS
jgi:hypothetical protein